MDKWRTRAKASDKITVDSKGNIEGSTWTQIRQYQEEFQREFCPLCLHYDQEGEDFQEKEHSNIKPDDCKHHWTDIIGQCWNFKPNKS